MATYEFTHTVAYLGGAFAGSGPSAETISDGDTDNQFEAGDTYEHPTYGTTTYVGTTVIDGQTWPVFVGSGIYASAHAVLMNATPVSPPATLVITNEVFPTCFLPGSLIATPDGAIAVEDLQIGDWLKTDAGCLVPVKWIGRQTVSTRFGPAERLMPVRFAAGSLGEGLPHSDLTVTADHGMLVDGVICHAGALVNGTTITRVPLAEMGETYTVYHIETEAHEIILANGAPAETFIDNVSRKVFDNYAEFETLYGDVPEMRELSYPRAMSARQVPARVTARLNEVFAA